MNDELLSIQNINTGAFGAARHKTAVLTNEFCKWFVMEYILVHTWWQMHVLWYVSLWQYLFSAVDTPQDPLAFWTFCAASEGFCFTASWGATHDRCELEAQLREFVYFTTVDFWVQTTIPFKYKVRFCSDVKKWRAGKQKCQKLYHFKLIWNVL